MYYNTFIGTILFLWILIENRIKSLLDLICKQINYYIIFLSSTYN